MFSVKGQMRVSIWTIIAVRERTMLTCLSVCQIPFGFREHDRRSLGLLWAICGYQITLKLTAGYAITVAHLWPSCITVVAFSFPFLPFRFLFPLPKERLNTSIETSKKNNNIKTHPANPMTCRVRNLCLYIYL